MVSSVAGISVKYITAHDTTVSLTVNMTENVKYLQWIVQTADGANITALTQ